VEGHLPSLTRPMTCTGTMLAVLYLTFYIYQNTFTQHTGKEIFFEEKERNVREKKSDGVLSRLFGRMRGEMR
jgi:hypothetical protein